MDWMDMAPTGATEYHEPLRRALQGLDSGKPLALVLRSFFTQRGGRPAGPIAAAGVGGIYHNVL